eukprot:scaffold753_cov199-Alexandrium_tamarense.AAC.6
MAMTTIIVLPTHSASTATADALKAACISSTTASMPTVHQVSFRFLLQLSERLGRPLSCLSSGEDDKYLVNDPDPMPSELLQHDDDVSLGDELPSDKDIDADSSGHLEAAYEKSTDDAQDEVATVVTAKNDAVSGKKRSRHVCRASGEKWGNPSSASGVGDQLPTKKSRGDSSASETAMTLENVQQTAATSLLSDIESKPSQAVQDIGDFDEVVNHPSNLSTLEHEIRGDYAPASEASASLALDNVQRETTASTQQFVTTSNSPQDPKDATRSQTILEAIQYRRELLKLTRDIRMATEEQLAMMDSVGGRQIAERARGRLTKKKQSDDKESEMQEFQQLSSSLLGSNDEDRVEDVVSGL